MPGHDLVGWQVHAVRLQCSINRSHKYPDSQWSVGSSNQGRQYWLQDEQLCLELVE